MQKILRGFSVVFLLYNIQESLDTLQRPHFIMNIIIFYKMADLLSFVAAATCCFLV